MHAHVDKAARQKLGIKTKRCADSEGRHRKGNGRQATGARPARSRESTSGQARITSIHANKKNARGKEFGVAISANNVYITELNLEDKLGREEARCRGKGQDGAPAQRRNDSERGSIKDDTMAKKGNSRHMKRLNAPIFFGIHRKEHKYMTKPSAGRHTLARCDTDIAAPQEVGSRRARQDAKRMLDASAAIHVNNSVVKDRKYAVGLNDVIEISR